MPAEAAIAVRKEVGVVEAARRVGIAVDAVS
jgi:hypothetical protein